MACFVYEGAVKQDGSKPADIKTVSLSWKTEFQKELIRKRIREKALREEATAVVIVTDAETQAAPEAAGQFLQAEKGISDLGRQPDRERHRDDHLHHRRGSEDRQLRRDAVAHRAFIQFLLSRESPPGGARGTRRRQTHKAPGDSSRLSPSFSFVPSSGPI